MAFLDKLKGLFAGKKKTRQEDSLYAALARQVDALENRLIISEHAKRIEGGVAGFDAAFDETRQLLTGYTGEGAGQQTLELLRKRMDLARQAAHLLREENPDTKKQMGRRFVADFRDLRDQLHLRTRTKYERIRIDFESGRLK